MGIAILLGLLAAMSDLILRFSAGKWYFSWGPTVFRIHGEKRLSGNVWVPERLESRDYSKPLLCLYLGQNFWGVREANQLILAEGFGYKDYTPIAIGLLTIDDHSKASIVGILPWPWIVSWALPILFFVCEGLWNIGVSAYSLLFVLAMTLIVWMVFMISRQIIKIQERRFREIVLEIERIDETS